MQEDAGGRAHQIDFPPCEQKVISAPLSRLLEDSSLTLLGVDRLTCPKHLPISARSTEPPSKRASNQSILSQTTSIQEGYAVHTELADCDNAANRTG
jgi:hypothetical protein